MMFSRNILIRKINIRTLYGFMQNHEIKSNTCSLSKCWSLNRLERFKRRKKKRRCRNKIEYNNFYYTALKWTDFFSEGRVYGMKNMRTRMLDVPCGVHRCKPKNISCFNHILECFSLFSLSNLAFLYFIPRN